MKLKKTGASWLTNRYQLIIRNEQNLAEKSTCNFNYAKLMALSCLILATLLALSLLLAHTLLAKWLNPTYMEQENKKKLTLLAAEVALLTTKTTQQTKFIEMLQRIIDGDKEPTYTLPDTEPTHDELTESPSLEALVEADSSLREEFESSKYALLPAYHRPMKDLEKHLFFSPITGMISNPFNPKIEHYGVDIVAKENSPIKCVADGIVIFSSWTVETGWVMAIQHNKDLVSIYKHCAKLLKKVGKFVTVGEVIAIMGNSGILSTGPHLHFELWYGGEAINPEYLINF